MTADNREAFEAWVFDQHKVHPTTWNKECAKFGHEVPAHKHNKYYFHDHQLMWEAWCAALASREDDARDAQAVLIDGTPYEVPMPVAAELLRLHFDARRLDWLQARADERKVELAKSIMGTGYEIGEWPSMRVTVTSGSLRQAIDAAIAKDTP